MMSFRIQDIACLQLAPPATQENRIDNKEARDHELCVSLELFVPANVRQ